MPMKDYVSSMMEGRNGIFLPQAIIEASWRTGDVVFLGNELGLTIPMDIISTGTNRKRMTEKCETQMKKLLDCCKY